MCEVRTANHWEPADMEVCEEVQKKAEAMVIVALGPLWTDTHDRLYTRMLEDAAEIVHRQEER